MKYIRTKDGVFIVEKENELYISCYNGHTNKMYAKEKNNPLSCGCDYIGKYKIVSTIEKLLDEFVVVAPSLSKPQNYSINEKTKSVMLDMIETSIVKIYCAIWTDKGLIYVAKMNNEGKLCLI